MNINIIKEKDNHHLIKATQVVIMGIVVTEKYIEGIIQTIIVSTIIAIMVIITIVLVTRVTTMSVISVIELKQELGAINARRWVILHGTVILTSMLIQGGIIINVEIKYHIGIVVQHIKIKILV